MIVLEIFQHGNPLAWDTCATNGDVFAKASDMQSRLAKESGLTLTEIHTGTMLSCSVLQPLTME